MGYYWALLYDPSLAVLLIAAVGVIYHANSRSRPSNSSDDSQSSAETAEESEQPDTLSTWKILILPVVGSIVLLVLFYFLKMLRWVLISVITVSSFSSTAYVIYPFLSTWVELLPTQFTYRYIRLPQRLANWLGLLSLPLAVPLSMAGSLLVIILWHVTNSWIITNIIALCLGVTSIVSLPLPNAMLSTLLLSIFWVYDIFWVFISPLIFPKNVMETVAIGVAQLELPMIIKIPRILPIFETATTDLWSVVTPNLFAVFDIFTTLLERLYSAGFMMLGLGDIVLPGLVLNFFFRRDEFLIYEEHSGQALPEEDSSVQVDNEEEEHKNLIQDQEIDLEADGLVTPVHATQARPIVYKSMFTLTYYRVAQAGYIFGLLLTFLMLILLNRSQPALLYLVPCTLIPPLTLAWYRGQFWWLWKSIETQSDSDRAENANALELEDLGSNDDMDLEIAEESLQEEEPVEDRARYLS